MGIFSQKEFDFLWVKDPICPIYHALPKLHKDKFPPPMRPIVAGIGSLNERLSEWVDGILQCPGYLRDTKSVLNIVKDIKGKNHFHWITSHIESLYTCKPRRLAIQAIPFHLDKHALYDHVTRQYILSVIEYLLGHNFFIFDGVFIYSKQELPWGQIFPFHC